MDRRAAWVLGILFGGLFLCLFSFLFLFYTAIKSESGSPSSISTGSAVGVLEVTGEIGDAKKFLKDVREFEHDDGVKAVVLRVNSPGGAVGPSQEMYDALWRLKKKKKVIVSMGSLAASGGFYIACAGDKIYANPGTLTGSIGVIMQAPNVEGLMKWAGVSMNTIKAGKMKDMGNPFREMKPEERQYLEAVLEDVHQQFIEAVARGRNMKVSEVAPLAEGQIFSGRQAQEKKLVDALGGFDDAVAEAGKLGGISGEPKLRYPKHDKKLLKEIFGDEEAESLFHGAASTLSQALGTGGGGLQYRMPVP